ncbi:MAG TPA: Gfo/Idh/MocA family oxidoreductase [Verrucomicrobiota bacterium]|nr:MAG: putative oxidoreductase YcjS [Candidatus Cloacimonetes bacterium ADurb.Bin117]HPY31742.1 Gfo/Idh/MocA family oxidoreductase [Verrucomicrobiota bacterium]HQB18012.1 Gfo/Idh/MocA family oxidoreductase [Verrucomicrobiota bacterium]
MKIAIIGCGKIADDHAWAIRCGGRGRIVAACDREPLMAGQFADRFAVEQTFTEMEEMLATARPDVVHITTPPQSHFALARQCLEHGCHVYVEKPFTPHLAETEELLELAESRGLKLTAGHDAQFCHASRRLRALAHSGYFGGPPVHMESYYCYDLGYGAYAKALLADRNHWVRQLPGQLLHNIISHGVARIAEYLQTDAPEVAAWGFVSPRLRALGETELVDELRVLVREDQRTTAYFTFSSQMRPALHEFRVYGPANGAVLDQDKQTLIRLRGARYPSFAEQFMPPWQFARQYAGNWWHNVRLFLRRDFHAKAGMKFLIEQFYRSIQENRPPPIPYREIRLTARIMDDIFRQLQEARERGATDPASVR